MSQPGVGWGIDALVAPRPVAGLVERPRLFALLDRGAQAPVTLLCAPAGSGKSVLLSSWLSRRGPDEPLAWVTVERGETDATRFWGTVMDALRRSGAIAPADPLGTLVPHEPQDEFLQRLLEGLGRLQRPLLLVIDDLHQLRSEDALTGLERLLDRFGTTYASEAGFTVRDTPAALFRTVEKYRPTLLIDEADTFLDERNELTDLVNSSGGFTRQMTAWLGVEYMDKLPVIPATSVKEIKERLQPFAEAGATRLIVPYVPVSEPVIDDARRFVEAWGNS